MKSRQSSSSGSRLPRGPRFALSTAALAIIMMALVAALVLFRPLLMAQVRVERPDLDAAVTESVAARLVTPTETAAEVGRRAGGDLYALPAAAFDRGRAIIVGVSDPFGHLNPLYGGGDGDQDAIALIFEPLLRIGPGGESAGVLAESIQRDPAARTITVLLRNDHLWRDGRAVNAADVVFTYRCLLSPSYDGPLAGRFDDIAGVTAGTAGDRQTVIFAFKPGVAGLDERLLTVGILKSDYYAVPADKVYEIGRRKLPPEGSGAYQWLETHGNRRILSLRDGFAGDILRIEQVMVSSDDKYPMLQSGALDIVRHDWSERIRSRVARLPAYAYYDAVRIDQYLLSSPEPGKNGLPADPAAIANLLRTATGQSGDGQVASARAPWSAAPISLAYFAGIDEAVARQQTANAELIKRRLEQAGQPVMLQPLSWPEVANRANLGTFQLLLLPAATDNRLPRQTVLLDSLGSRPANAAIAFQHPEILLVSARLEGLTANARGACFAASPLTFSDGIAKVRVLDADGVPVTE